MSNNIRELANSIRAKVNNGLNIDEVIYLLHQNHFTITQSMKFLVEEFDIRLAEAKKLVSCHPVWYDVVEASEPLKEELINSIEKKGDGG